MTRGADARNASANYYYVKVLHDVSTVGCSIGADSSQLRFVKAPKHNNPKRHPE